MSDETYGNAPVKAEGESVDYEYQPRTPEETIKYLQERLTVLRAVQGKYVRVKSLARQGRLMVANADGFTLVEDLDEYLTGLVSRGPLTKADIIREALGQMEEAFGENYKLTP